MGLRVCILCIMPKGQSSIFVCEVCRPRDPDGPICGQFEPTSWEMHSYGLRWVWANSFFGKDNS